MTRRRRCECAEGDKLPGEDSCARCKAMDGGSTPEQDVIAALQGLGGTATLAALQVELGRSGRHIQRTLERLKAIGRVRRVDPEVSDGREVGRLGSNVPVFVLVQTVAVARAVPLWAQLVFGVRGFAARCRCERSERVLSGRGRLLGWHCGRCLGVVGAPRRVKEPEKRKEWRPRPLPFARNGAAA